MPKSQQENKKVKNAHPLEYQGIQFKSQLEKMTYVTLKEAGFPVEYEPRTFTLWEGMKPTVPFYDKDKVSRMLKLNDKKIISIKHTPDFVFEYKGYLVIIESKGLETDRYFLYKKLFRAWLEEHEPKSIFFEIYSKKQLLQAIEIIKNLN